MEADNKFYKYFAFKGRFVSYTSLSILPLMGSDTRTEILVIALIVSLFILAIEKKTERIRVLVIWVGGIASSIAITLLITNWFLQIIFYVTFLMIAAGLLYKGSGSDVSGKGT